jgi:hypothetical protein
MIQINELRIGNFVMTNNSKYRTEDVGKIACITQIDSERTFEEIKGTVSLYLIEDKWKETYGQWLIYIEPIPITEEWLLKKFGFEKSKNFESLFILSLTEWAEIHVHLYKDDCAVEISISKHSITVETYYIHQLQNLYFSLTGKELEICK